MSRRVRFTGKDTVAAAWNEPNDYITPTIIKPEEESYNDKLLNETDKWPKRKRLNHNHMDALKAQRSRSKQDKAALHPSQRKVWVEDLDLDLDDWKPPESWFVKHDSKHLIPKTIEGDPDKDKRLGKSSTPLAANSEVLNLLAQGASKDVAYCSKERYPPPRCHPGTRKALLDRVWRWAESMDGGICWIHGPAGAGKSAIAQTVSETWAERGQLAASFFFSQSTPGRDVVLDLFTTIAFQIATHAPDKLDMDYLPTIDLGWVLNLNMFRSSPNETSSPFIVVIDGLDQCGTIHDQIQILNHLDRLVERCSLRFLVLSRPESYIRSCIYRCFNLAEIPLYADLEAREDIYAFLRGRFEEIHNSAKHASVMKYIQKPWPSDEVVRYLTEQSGGYFIYASTVIEYVNREFPCVDRLHEILNIPGLGSGLFAELDLHSQVLSICNNINMKQHDPSHSAFSSLQLFDQCITADLAFDHTSEKEANIRGALHSIGYEGSYLIQVGFNEELMDLGQYEQEIYLFLEYDIPNEAYEILAGIFHPFSERRFQDLQHTFRSHSTGNSRTVGSAPVPAPGGSGMGTGSGSSANGKDRDIDGNDRDDRAGGKDPSDPREEGKNPPGKQPSEKGRRTITIPFCSTLNVNTLHERSLKFVTISSVEINIQENDATEFPPGSNWPGPWFTVDMKTLKASADGVLPDKSRPTLGLSQVLINVLSCPSLSLLHSSPSTTYFHDDTVKSKSERTDFGGGQITIGPNPSLRIATSTNRVSGDERSQKRWAIKEHWIDSGNDISSEYKAGMLWKYTHNDNMKIFPPISGQNFSDLTIPCIVFGLDESEVLPSVDVEVVMHWKLTNVTQSGMLTRWFKGGKNSLPGFTNFLHHASISVDLGKVPYNRSYVPAMRAYDEGTLGEPTHFDPVNVLARGLDSNCVVSLRRAIHGRIEPLTLEERTGALCLLSRPESFLSIGLPTPAPSPVPSPPSLTTHPFYSPSLPTDSVTMASTK